MVPSIDHWPVHFVFLFFFIKILTYKYLNFLAVDSGGSPAEHCKLWQPYIHAVLIKLHRAVLLLSTFLPFFDWALWLHPSQGLHVVGWETGYPVLYNCCIPVPPTNGRISWVLYPTTTLSIFIHVPLRPFLYYCHVRHTHLCAFISLNWVFFEMLRFGSI